MKKGRKVNAITSCLAISTLLIGGHNAFCNDKFFEVSIAQVLTLLVTISIAFWATQFKNDQRNAKAHAEKIISKIQIIVSSENFYTFVPDENEEDIKRDYRMRQRRLSNLIQVLKEYEEMFEIKSDIKYIYDQLREYKSFVSEKLNDFAYLHKSETYLRKLSQNIDSKCDQLVVKLYK